MSQVRSHWGRLAYVQRNFRVAAVALASLHSRVAAVALASLQSRVLCTAVLCCSKLTLSIQKNVDIFGDPATGCSLPLTLRLPTCDLQKPLLSLGHNSHAFPSLQSPTCQLTLRRGRSLPSTTRSRHTSHPTSA